VELTSHAENGAISPVEARRGQNPLRRFDPEHKLLISRPGQWIDRFGRPQDKPTIRRILVVKVDHIGDLLIADDAFSLLRSFFPDARLELICGTWNVELARRLGWFDTVHGLDFFHEVSGLQSDFSHAAASFRMAAEQLDRLNLGFYDLAIDLRYDHDSRRILQHIDATIRAGYGKPDEFPFVDVLLPTYDVASTKGPSKLHLAGGELAPLIALAQPIYANGDLTARRREVWLQLEIDGAISPKDCGVGDDNRLLGVGLESIAIHVAGSQSTSPPNRTIDVVPTFASGWGIREPWGTWTVQTCALLAIAIPSEIVGTDVRLDLTFRANIYKAPIRCVIRSVDELSAGPALVEIEWQTTRQQTASVTVPIVSPVIRLASKRFALIPGRYSGELCLYMPSPLRSMAEINLVVRGMVGQAAVARQTVDLQPGMRGISSIGLDFLIDAAGEDLRLELETRDLAALEGCRIEYFSLQADQIRKTNLPNAHMRDRAALLVLNVARIFSQFPPLVAGVSDAHARGDDLQRLVVEPELTDARRAVFDRLDRWRAEGSILVGLAMGCNSAIRKWPRHYFVELAREIMEIGDLKIVFVGGSHDSEDARFACDELGLDSSEHELCGKFKLEELGSLLNRLNIFIGNNSGITHFAGKVGVRTIGIYAGTNHPREWGPLGEKASWIYREETCAPCHLSNLADCKQGHVCLVRIRPMDVFAVVGPELRTIATQRRSNPITPATSRPIRGAGLTLEPGAAALEKLRILSNIRRQASRGLADFFDEEWYLAAYPDIALAIDQGSCPGALSHFMAHGRSEGRAGFAFDRDWYLKAYPLAKLEIDRLAVTPEEHYATLGAARGYLPHRAAMRPDDPAKLSHRFGGLWIDTSNARDRIEGRLETDAITLAEAETLDYLREHGYCILQKAISDDLLAGARLELERAYQGGFEDLLFDCPSVGQGQMTWRPEINNSPAKALDFHMFSGTIRNLMFTESIMRFLSILFECHPLASQTLGFLRGSAQSGHQDSAYVPYSIPRQFAASWIALEDVSAEAGELFYYPGSHRFDDFVYCGRFKSVSEAQRHGCDPRQIAEDVERHVRLLPSLAAEQGLPQKTFLAKAGDVLIWHADLVHGGLKVSKELTRKSVVTHYCPRFLAPLYMEAGDRGYHAHHSGGYFTSSVYPGMQPIG
jgi:ADP-heptose:LPS heptosyltransferase/ectoine hydroxylase-related dioxygenase (phytanoyl-CoA dioxygenase family)